MIGNFPLLDLNRIDLICFYNDKIYFPFVAVGDDTPIALAISSYFNFWAVLAAMNTRKS